MPNEQEHCKVAHNTPITSEKYDIGNSICPLQIHLAGFKVSVYTNLRVDNCKSLRVMVPKVIIKHFGLTDRVRDGHAIIDSYPAWP